MPAPASGRSPGPYIHPERVFEQTGTTFAFLTFGAATIIYALLKLRGTSNSDEVTYQAVEADSVDEETELNEREEERDGKHLRDPSSAPTDGQTDRKAGSRADAKTARPGRIDPVDCSRDSILKLMSHLSQFGAILMYSWFCENMPIFNHGEKHYNRDLFWFITLVYLGFSFTTITPNPKDTSLLNRDQTEEWKGWMQFLFLMYHYFHASEVYNAIRIFISCYVWMTGFGNFSFFYIKRDFGFVRFWQMLWRLNFLVFWLIMVHGNTFILYYINPLHTFYFLLVFATMYAFSSSNHKKWPVRAKLLAVAALVFVIWDIPGVFHLAFGWLSPEPVIGARNGTFHEWHFRSGLDHYSAVFGMAFALNYPMSTAWLKSLEELPSSTQWLVKGGISVVCAAVMFVWTQAIFSLKKYQYNEHHPYWFWVPLLVYIFVRNVSVTLRSYHLGLLTRMGKITLETYLMQHHIWLTSNAKSLLVLIPDSPLCNFFFVSALYLYLSHRLFRLTVALRAMLIPNEAAAAWTLLLAMITTLSSLYGTARLLTLMGGGVILVIFCTSLVGFAGFFLVEKIIAAESVQDVRTPYFALTGVLGGLTLVTACASGLSRMTTAWGADDQNQGGVATSASLGLLAVTVFATIVLSMDNFVGLSYLSSIMGQSYPSWEDAYSALHNKIFLG